MSSGIVTAFTVSTNTVVLGSEKAAEYKDKADSEVKDADDERLRNLTAEVETLDAFVASLKKLTLQ